MRPVFGGSTGIVLASEKSAGNKDSPVVFVHTVRLSHKDANERGRLQSGLSKQMGGRRERVREREGEGGKKAEGNE